MSASLPDLTPFFQAVIQHLAMSPGGTTFIAKLGLDPSIKLAWSALNLSKSKKMANIIDTRPDLFSRFMTDRAQPMVKLEAKGYECLAYNEVLPLGLDESAAAAPDAGRTGGSSSSCASPPSAGGTGTSRGVPLNLSVTEARKLFLRHVLDAVAAKDGCVIDLPQLGSVPEVQQAWKMSGLDKKLKMSDVLKERPDLVMVSVSENGSAMVALTELAIMCVQTGEIPEPDSSCPPPVQATKKRNSSGPRPGGAGPMRYGGNPGGGGYGMLRYEPYGAPAAAAPAWAQACPGGGFTDMAPPRHFMEYPHWPQ